VHRFAILRQDHAPVLAARFWNPRPSAYPSIRLDLLTDRIGDSALNPFGSDVLPVFPLARVKEVLGELHVFRLIPHLPQR